MGNFSILPKIARALKFKGIPYETINYNGILGAKVPLLSKVGKVPVIDHKGQRIQDSTRIARYLDETFRILLDFIPKTQIKKHLQNFGKTGQMNHSIFMKYI